MQMAGAAEATAVEVDLEEAEEEAWVKAEERGVATERAGPAMAMGVETEAEVTGPDAPGVVASVEVEAAEEAMAAAETEEG